MCTPLCMYAFGAASTITAQFNSLARLNNPIYKQLVCVPDACASTTGTENDTVLVTQPTVLPLSALLCNYIH